MFILTFSLDFARPPHTVIPKESFCFLQKTKLKTGKGGVGEKREERRDRMVCVEKCSLLALTTVQDFDIEGRAVQGQGQGRLAWPRLASSTE